MTDVWQDYVIFERVMPSGKSQYFGQSPDDESPIYLVELPANLKGVEQVMFVHTDHWNADSLVIAVMGLAVFMVVRKKPAR